MVEKIICQECGQKRFVVQRHTIEDCNYYKKYLEKCRNEQEKGK